MQFWQACWLLFKQMSGKFSSKSDNKSKWNTFTRMKSFLRTLVETRGMVFWQACRKKMPKLQKFPLIVTSSKKLAFFESVVCLKKALRNRKSYKRQINKNYFDQCPKLFFILIFGKTLLPHNVFLDTDNANLSNLLKIPLESLEGLPIEGQIYQTQKIFLWKSSFCDKFSEEMK